MKRYDPARDCFLAQDDSGSGPAEAAAHVEAGLAPANVNVKGTPEVTPGARTERRISSVEDLLSPSEENARPPYGRLSSANNNNNEHRNEHIGDDNSNGNKEEIKRPVKELFAESPSTVSPDTPRKKVDRATNVDEASPGIHTRLSEDIVNLRMNSQGSPTMGVELNEEQRTSSAKRKRLGSHEETSPTANTEQQPSTPLSMANLPKIKRRKQDTREPPPYARKRSRTPPRRDDRRDERREDRRDDRRNDDRYYRPRRSRSPPRHENIYTPRARSRSPTAQTYKRRAASPSHRYRYRSPPPPIIPKEPEPLPIDRNRESSPPRQRKKPGPSSRLSDKEKAELKELERKRAEEAEKEAQRVLKERGVEEVVRAHYNDKRELGKTWRKTDSRIKGLRGFNNWVKSTIIQKFSPNDDFDPRNPRYNHDLTVLDLGCGKGGDLLKWKSAPQEVGLYVGVDTADVSIVHARDRYDSMRSERRGGRRLFSAEFHPMDCWTRWIGEIPIIAKVGVDPNVGPGQSGRISARWGGGGFDVVSMMFCMHYAFESETKCRNMLRNVAGALKKGGRFIGTIPSSDVISNRVQGKNLPDGLPADQQYGVREWGNSIYRIRFAEEPPKNGVFRPPWGWKYSFFLEEAVEEVPEYVVPWEAFRAIAEDYNLELIYKKPFHDVWMEEKEDPDLKVLSERMGVRDREGKFALGGEEWEACGLYLAFVFRKA